MGELMIFAWAAGIIFVVMLILAPIKLYYIASRIADIRQESRAGVRLLGEILVELRALRASVTPQS